MKKQILFLILGIFLISLISAQFSENISVTTGWNEIEFNIIPGDNSLSNVLSSISGQYVQIKTMINNQVDMWAEGLPPFAIDLYDINFNQTYLIEMKQDDIIELIGEPNPLIPYLINTSWSNWENISSCYDNDTLDIQRNKTQYDYNQIISNITYFENNLDSCDFCIPLALNRSWSSWQNQSYCTDKDTQLQNQSMSDYDNNNCYSQTSLPSDIFLNTTYWNYQNITCDYCTPIPTIGIWSDWVNMTPGCRIDDYVEQNRSRSTYDPNNCYGTTGLLADYVDPNITFDFQLISCDFCTPVIINSTPTDWQNQTSCFFNDTIVLNRSWIEHDLNGCFAQTGLADDNFTNFTYWETNVSDCDFCTPNMVNTSWTEWTNISSCYVNNTLQQQRNKTTYDNNSCGEELNQTFSEYQTSTCRYILEIDVCDSGCDYTKVSNAIDDLYCYNHTSREYNFTNCTKFSQPLRILVHNGNRSRFEIINLSNIEIIGETKEEVYINGDNIYSNFILKYSENITIKNYTIDNGWQGLWMTHTNNCIFENIDSSSDSQYAFFINDSDNNLFSHWSCDQVDNQSCYRIHLYSDNNIIEYSEAQNAYYNGIVVAYHTNNNTVRNSILHDNGYDGIFVGTNSTYNYFYNNTAYNNGASALRFYYSSNYNVVDKLESYNNTDDGLIIKGAQAETYDQAYCEEGDQGIFTEECWVNGSNHNIIKNSYFHDNNDNGIFLLASHNNSFININSSNNYWHGVSNAGSHNTSVINSILNAASNGNRSGIYTEKGNNFYIENITAMHNDVGVFNLNSSNAIINNSYFHNNSEGVYINSESRNVAVINNNFYLNHIGVWISVLVGSPEDDSIRINNTYVNKGCDVDYSTLGCQEDYTDPGPIQDLSAWSTATNNEIRLNFTSSGDNFINGSNYGYWWDNSNEDYIVKYYNQPIDESNWDLATTYVQGWTPLTSESVDERLMNMPDYGYYWIAIQAVDDNGRKNNISNSVQVLSPHWEMGIYKAQCRNKRTLWGCNETDGVSSPTTNYWFDTFTFNLTVNNTGNVEQTRPTYAYVKDGSDWVGEFDADPFANQFNYNFTLGSGQSVDLGNIDVVLNLTEEGYHQTVVSIKDINPDACGPFSEGTQCTHSTQPPWGSRNYRSFSMKKHLSLVIDPEHWGDSVVPVETGNNTANSYFYMDVFFCNNNTQIYYNHVPFNFSINTTYPWEANVTRCGSARGHHITDDNPLQNKTGWYHLPSNTCDYTQYCTWGILGLPPGLYNFSYSTGYYEEDKPNTVSIVGRFV